MNKNKILKTFRTPPVLKTKRLVLRKISLNDYRDMYEYAKQACVTKYLLWNEHESEEHTYDYIRSVISAYKKGDFFDWAVTLADSGKMIGTCGFTSFDFEHGRVEVGYVLNPEYWNMGIGTEAVGAVIEFAFNEFDANRVEAHFIEGNKASLRVMEKCGMTFEGIHRQYMLVKGEYKNIGFAAITRDQFISKDLYVRLDKNSPFLTLPRTVEKI